jgi:hypothetical protein
MLRLTLLAIALFCAGPAAAAGPDLPYGKPLEFSAFRNGQRIGIHRLTFEKEGERLVVTTQIDLAVKVIGLTAYRYSHRSRETWLSDTLQSFESRTDDNGKAWMVRASRDASGLKVERTVPDAAAPERATMPAATMPSTHWNARQAAQGFLLNAQKGTQEEIAVTPLGREQVRTLSGFVPATHYRYDGGVRMEQWFDERGRWVKSRFTVSDGSVIDYLLQE